MATGAGADRISSGMKLSFGRPVGTAARVYENEIIMVARINSAGAKQLKDALHKASFKLPTPCKIKITKGNEIAGKIGL